MNKVQGAQLDLNFKTMCLMYVSGNSWDMIKLKKFSHLSEIQIQPRFYLTILLAPSFKGCSWIIMSDPGLEWSFSLPPSLCVPK